jgi:predicted aspartyl protease
MKNRIFTLILFIIFSASLQAQSETDYKLALETLFNAFKERNYDLLKPLLDPNTKIADFPKGMNDRIIPQIMAQLPTPFSYSVIGKVEEKDGLRIKVFYSTINGAMEKSFLFNNQGKIIDFDVLEGASVMKKQFSQLTSRPDRVEIPFQIHNGIIYVNVLLNGKEEKFILDSGAPSLILNSDLKIVKNMPEASSKKSIVAKGVGGAIKNINEVHINVFNWNGIEIKDAKVLTMPLSHVGKYPFTGLIGYDVFKDYKLTFDYKKRIITATLNKEAEEYGKLLATIPFEMEHHLPVFRIDINGKTYKMGLDTGASANLLYEKYTEEIKNFIKSDNKALILGAANGVNARQGKIKTLKIGDLEYKDMSFAFENNTLDQINDGYKADIDGLLGYEFLRQHVTTVDFISKEIRIYSGT